MSETLFQSCCTRSIFRLLARSISQQQQPQLSIARRQFHDTAQNGMPINRMRGASAIKRRPIKGMLSVPSRKFPLPEPELDPEKRSKPIVRDDHGLWGFFNAERVCFPTPEDDFKHGRAWTVHELRAKSWEDLHRLWWTCVKQRNMIATQTHERKRVEAGYGDSEAENRDEVVRRTQQAIKHVLTERFYAWEDSVHRSWIVRNPAKKKYTRLVQGAPPPLPKRIVKGVQAAAEDGFEEEPEDELELGPEDEFEAKSEGDLVPRLEHEPEQKSDGGREPKPTTPRLKEDVAT